MTIYAIINDLLSPLSDMGSPGPIWTLISPASILQGGNPYFVPDFASRFEARAAMAVRIGKLGKGIAPRFARRYVDGVASAVVFVAADRLDTLKARGLPWTSALSYDRSLAIGKFQQMDFDEIARSECSCIIASADSREQKTATSTAAPHDVGMILEAISHDNTLKTGDIILVGISGSGVAVASDMRARLRINGEDGQAFNIR